MAVAPLGRAYIEVKADLSGFATDVRAEVQKALKEGTAGLNFGFEDKIKDEIETGAEEGGQELEKRLPDHAKKAGSKSGSSFWGGFSSVFSGLFSAWLPILIGYGLEVAAALLPAVYALGASIPAAITVAVAAAGTLVLAFHGVGTAIGAAFAGDPDKLAEAMKKLSPAAREFVTEIQKASPVLKQLQQDVQNVFFVQLEGSITRIVKSILPTLHDGLVGIASDLGKMGAGLANALAGSKGDLAKVFVNTRLALQPLIPSLGQFVAAFIKLAAAAGPFVTIMSKGLADIAAKFLNVVTAASANGGLSTIFQDALIVLSDFGGLLKNVLGLVSEILGTLGATGEEAIGTLGFVVGLLKDFFATAAGNDALAAIFNLLNVALSTLGTILAPLLPVLGQFVGQLANGLSDSLLQLTPALTNISKGAAQLLTDLSPLIPAVNNLVSALAPILTWLTQSPDLLAAAALAWGAYQIAQDAATAAAVAFDIAADANPVGAIVLGVEALVAGIVLLIVYWKDVKKWGESAWHGIQDAWNAAWKFFVDLGKNIGNWVDGVIAWFEAIPGKIINVLENLPSLLYNQFRAALQWVADAVAYGIGYLIGFWITLPSKMLTAVEDLGPKLVNWIEGALTATWNVISSNWDMIFAYWEAIPGRIVGAVTSLAQLLPNFFIHLWDQAKSAFVNGAEAVIDFAKSLPSRLGNFFSGAGGSILNSLKSGINDVIRSFNKGIDAAAGPLHAALPHIPYLAQGAIISSPTLAMIGEGGSPEVVIPLGNPTRAQQLADESGLTKMLLAGLQAPAINFTAILGTGQILDVLDQRVSLANAGTSQSIAFGARSN